MYVTIATIRLPAAGVGESDGCVSQPPLERRSARFFSVFSKLRVTKT
jgi:hypothetical protein